MRPKVGVFSFTSCEGCQLQLLSLEDDLLELLKHIEIVNFREAMDLKGDDYAIAFVEGSITRTSEIKKLEAIRKNAKIVIAYGACAALGGVNVLKNFHPKREWLPTVYGREDLFTDTIPTKRIEDVVEVNYTLPGCPVDKKEVLRFIKSLLIGMEPRLPGHPVCVECRSKGNVCLYEREGGRGTGCIGSVTRAGCDAICPTYGEPCVGCRGFVDAPNIASLKTVMKENGLCPEEVKRRFTLFNGLETSVLND